jgi:hypothetical protein
MALVAGRNRVPRPATGKIAVRTDVDIRMLLFVIAASQKNRGRK